MAGERLAVEIASARSLPLFTCGSAVGSGSKIICTCPASNAGMDCPLPLNGTCTRLMPVMNFSNSIARWLELPEPDDE